MKSTYQKNIQTFVGFTSKCDVNLEFTPKLTWYSKFRVGYPQAHFTKVFWQSRLITRISRHNTIYLRRVTIISSRLEILENDSYTNHIVWGNNMYSHSLMVLICRWKQIFLILIASTSQIISNHCGCCKLGYFIG